MSEQPSEKPTSDLTWASAGTRTPPSAGDKLTGFVYGDVTTAVEINWRWYERWYLMQWLYANSIRRFDTAYDAVTTLSAGDLFRLTPDDPITYGSALFASGISSSSHGTCVDGAHFYVGYPTSAIKRTLSSPVSTAWSVGGFDLGDVISHSACDGQIMAIAGNGTGAPVHTLIILDASNGSVLGNRVVGIHSQVRHVAVDCNPTNECFWLTNLDNNIYRWLAGAYSTWSSIGAAYYACDIALTPSCVVVAGATATPNWQTKEVYVKHRTTGATLAIPISINAGSTGGLPEARVATDGEWVWLLRGSNTAATLNDYQISGAPLLGVPGAVGTPAWTITVTGGYSTVAPDRIRMTADHRWLYVCDITQTMIIDKYSGAIVASGLPSSYGGIDTDGTGFYLAPTISSFTKYSSARPADGLWCVTSGSRGQRLPRSKLIVPVR